MSSVHVWNGLDEVPHDLGATVATLGNFDGVHRGHRAVLRQLTARASEIGATSVAVTFEPHPIAVLYPERAPVPLTSIDQRLALLAETGLDAVLVLEFTREFASQTPAEFVDSVFVQALHARAIVVGADTRFGVRNSGSVETLRELGADRGFEVTAVADVGEGERWSSTRIRAALADGDIPTAATMLGRLPRVQGVVVHGDHRGRLLGFPTANLGGTIEGLIPADGVYAGWLTRLDLPEGAPDRMLPTAVSIGTNPTFDGVDRRVEGYVLDRSDLDLYGERIAYDVVARLRETLRFDGIEPLITQMHADVTECRGVLGLSSAPRPLGSIFGE